MSTGKILIVEGDLTLSGMLQNQLRDKGYVVDTQQTAEKAFEELRREWVDLLIVSTDLQGEMDGFRFIKELKKDKDLCNIPVLIDSSKPGIKEVVQNLGISGYFEKPLDVEDLKKKVAEIIEKKGQANVDKM